MKRFVAVGLVVATLGLAGCAETGKYPGGDLCGPTDPVQKLDVKDCTVPVS